MKRLCWLLVFIVLVGLSLLCCSAAETTENGLCYSICNNEVIIERYLGDEETLFIPAYIDGYPVTTICLWNGTWNNPNISTKRVVLPETVITLSAESFTQMTGLAKIDGLEYVQVLAGYNFHDTRITEMTFSANLHEVGPNGFECETVAMLSIPDDISFSADYSIFRYNFALRQIDLIQTGNEPTITKNGPAVYTADMKTLLVYPSAYTGLMTYSIPEGVERIAQNAFQIRDTWNTDVLQDITLPSTLQEMDALSLYDGSYDISPETGAMTRVYRPVLHVYPDTRIQQFCQDIGYTFYLRDEMDMTFQKRIDQIISESIQPGMTDYDKAYAINEWLVNNAIYDDTFTFYYPNGILFEGRGVCQSFTLTYNLILNHIGISSRPYVVNAIHHGFNAVLLNGETCYIDVTWNENTQSDIYFGMNLDMVTRIYDVDELFDKEASKNTGYQNYHRYRLGNYDQFLTHCLDEVAEAIDQHFEELAWSETEIFLLCKEYLPADHQAWQCVDCAILAAYLRDQVFDDSIYITAKYNNECVNVEISYGEPFPSNFEVHKTNEGICIDLYTGLDDDVIIPEMILGYPVVEIGANAFNGRKDLKRVTIPDTVTQIGAYAFCDSGIEEIRLPRVIQSIGDSAFSYCNNLTEIYIPENAALGKGICSFCKNLRKAHIACPINNSSIALFYGCAALDEVHLPSDMESIPDYTFGLCYSLRDFSFPNGITEIGIFAFDHCGFSEIQIPDTVQYIGASAFSTNELLSVNLPRSLKTIGAYAFEHNCSLKDVFFNQGLESIESYAFQDTSIENLEIPSSVNTIGPACFYHCAEIQRITVAEDNANYMAENNVLFSKDKTIVYLSAAQNTGAITIPGSVTEISDGAFALNQITSISFEGPITRIGESAFTQCEELTHVIIPEGVEVLPECCFLGCSSLLHVSLPNTLRDIEPYAFEGCYDLHIKLPDSVAYIGHGALPMNTTVFRIPLAMTRIESNLLPASVGRIYAHENVTYIGLNNLCSDPHMVYGFGGTYAEQYANESGFTFVDLRTAVNGTWDDPVYEWSVQNESVTAWRRDIFDDAIIETETVITEFGIIQPATCTELGIGVYTAVFENQGFETQTKEIELPVVNHAEEYDAAVAATCTETGLTEGSHCSACGVILVAQETVPALGHSAVTDAAVAPTCTETGLTEGSHCTVCGEILVAQTVVPALGHTAVADAAVAPTCTETGLTEGSHCTVCGEILVAQTVVPALGHTAVTDAAVSPTCTETGLTEGSHCTVCGEILVAQTVVPALGHTSVTDAAVAATCTETGLTEGSHCLVCGEVLVAQVTVPALGHTEVTDAAVAATCTETGLTEGSHCSVCGEVLVGQEIVLALGHTTAKDAAVSPTCTEAGLAEGSHCLVCGEVLVAQVTVPALGHAEATDAAVAATCTETGLTEGSHCSVCGEVLVAQEVIPALGHTIVTDDAVAATCTETGLTVGSHCSVCGEVLVAQESVPALGHTTAIDAAIPATCTETGLTEGSHCSVCGEVLVTQEEIPAHGHDEGVWTTITEPTATTEGLKELHCTLCDALLETQAIPATGIGKVAGDLNGDGKVNLKDSMLLLQYLAGWEVEFNEVNADVNGDGKVNLKDSMLLLQYLAGWESEYIN